MRIFQIAGFLGLFFCGFTASAEVIGVSLPLTGPAASYGNDIKNMLVFFNEVTGSPKHELLIEDDKCDPKEALTIARKFVASSKVRFVIGYPCSSTIHAVASLYQQNKIILISPAAAAPSVSTLGDYVWRTRPPDIGAAKLLADFVGARHQKVAVVAEQTEYAENIAATFSDFATRVSVVRENVAPAAADYRDVALRLKAKGVNAVVIFTQTEDSLYRLVKALKDIQPDIALYSSIFPASKVFLDKANSLAQGMVFANLPELARLADKEGLALFKVFVRRFGEPATMDNLFMQVNRAYLVVDALRSKTAEEAIAMLTHTAFPSPFGEFTFDVNGDLADATFELFKIVQRPGEARAAIERQSP